MIIVLHQRRGEILAVNTAQFVSIQETQYDGDSATNVQLTDGAVFNIKESPEEVAAKTEGAKQ